MVGGAESSSWTSESRSSVSLMDDILFSIESPAWEALLSTREVILVRASMGTMI